MILPPQNQKAAKLDLIKWCNILRWRRQEKWIKYIGGKKISISMRLWYNTGFYTTRVFIQSMCINVLVIFFLTNSTCLFVWNPLVRLMQKLSTAMVPRNLFCEGFVFLFLHINIMCCLINLWFLFSPKRFICLLKGSVVKSCAYYILRESIIYTC